MALAPGTLFASKYRIVGLLAEGGMGAVYEAEQVKVGRRVALKTMRPELVADEAHRRRFEQEARASARFESDYVVKVYDHDIDRETGIPWIEMELLRGEHLGALVERRGPLPVAEVRAIFDDLAKGLGPAHAAGVIHLDLKPENLFMVRMQDRAVVKVLDFGIAKIAAEQRKSAAITTLFASPMFLAPEQARKSARVTAATDVWALGLIAFYLLTGRYYWAAANLAPGEVFDQGAQLELLMEISTSTFDPPSARARGTGETTHRRPRGAPRWRRGPARAPRADRRSTC
jgi:serine/threonine protein kinase